MKDAFIAIMCSIIIGIFLSGKIGVEYSTAKLVNEIHSKDEKGCQVFREWKLNNKRIGCCTDNRSEPLTLCIDEYGEDTKEVKKLYLSVWY